MLAPLTLCNMMVLGEEGVLEQLTLWIMVPSSGNNNDTTTWCRDQPNDGSENRTQVSQTGVQCSNLYANQLQVEDQARREERSSAIWQCNPAQVAPPASIRL
ncbi:uncharacterized protein LOC144197658 isoform X2 [Stigmatopora nigra]